MPPDKTSPPKISGLSETALHSPASTRAALSGVVVGLLTLRYLGSPLVTSPWGPYQCILPLFAMFALTARFGRRDPGSWLAAALLGGVNQLRTLLRARKGGLKLEWGNGDGEGACEVHNPGYDFNDEALALGASFFARLVETRLSPD